MRINTAMILVAVVALCLTVVKPRADLVLGRIDATLPYLAAATVAIVALRLWPPHPPLKRLASQPGLLACGVATVMLTGAAAGSLVLGALGGMIFGSPPPPLATLFRSVSDWGYLVGMAVLVSWVVLGAVRGWRAEPNGFDRVGRVIGWAWVLLAPAGLVLRLMILLGSLL